MPTFRARFRRRNPLPNLKELTLMFDTLILQYLNKLVKSKVRDFTSPEAFHSLKVQCLGDNVVKLTTQVSGAFVVPISALIRDFHVKPCELTDSTPPIARPFLLATHGFIEFSEFVQGLFQGLWMLNLLTGAQCQIGFHAKVYPYAFTCSGQHFWGGVICHNIEPIRAGSVPTDLDITDIAMPLTMLMEREVDFLILVELFRNRIPHSKRDTDTPLLKFIGIRELRRSIFITLFELRGTDASASLSLFEKIKKLFPRKVQANNNSVKRVTGYPCPLSLGAVEQLRQVRLQAIPAGIFPIDAVISIFQSKEVIMHVAKFIEHIAQAHILRMLAYLIFVSSHSVTSYQFFNPFSVGWQTHYQAVMLRMSANW